MVAVAGPLSEACPAPAGDSDDPASLVAADVCATVAIAGLTPDACATSAVLNQDEIADVCVDVDLDPTDASACGSTAAATTVPGGPTTTPGGPTTTTPGGPATTSPAGPTTTDPTGPTTTIAGGVGPSTSSPGDDVDGGGSGTGTGGGTRPGVRTPDEGLGRLPMTGLAVGGTVVLAGLLVATGTFTRLLGRAPSRR